MMPAILDCESVRMSKGTIKALLDCKPRVFNSGQTLYAPTKSRDMDVGGTEVQIKSDPTDGNKFRLHINGKNVFSVVQRPLAVAETNHQQRHQTLINATMADPIFGTAIVFIRLQ